VAHEAVSSNMPQLKNIFWETTWKNRNLGSITQAGLINNLNDAMVWGIFPILLASKSFSIEQIGIITAVYPAVWSIGQIFTGKMADNICKKDMLFWGMVVQTLALILIVFASSITHFILLAGLLGLGTAMVYPTFLAAIAENTHPYDRANSLGVFRFWRDLGYAVGAIITGIIADAIGINVSIFFIAVLTFTSGLIICYRMTCNRSLFKLISWLSSKILSNKIISDQRRYSSAIK
jgi:MFS family permease